MFCINILKKMSKLFEILTIINLKYIEPNSFLSFLNNFGYFEFFKNIVQFYILKTKKTKIN
jgi:hypothetical protein